MGKFTEKHPFLPRMLCGVLGAVLTIVCCVVAGPFTKGEDEIKGVQGSPSDGVKLPVVMYHNVMPDGSQGLGDYVITASELKEDLQLMRDAGYQSVTGKEVIDYARGVGKLPEKPVLITFDDGYESMLQVVLPILEEYQCKAVASVVGKYVDFYSGKVPKELKYSHLGWEQVKELQDSGLVEIGSHTYDMHELEGRRGVKQKQGESAEAYRKALSDDLLLLQEKCRDHLSREPQVLAYPYGFYNKESEKLAKEFGFSMTLTCEEGVSTITGKDSLFALKRYNRAHGVDRQSFFAKMGIEITKVD